MKLITVAGPPSSGKTSVITKVVTHMQKSNYKVGVIKFDCLSTTDKEQYEKYNIKVNVGLSGGLCPDHFFVTNIEDCMAWGVKEGLDVLITESAGLCNRCSPHIKNIVSLCVIDNLSGHNTPKKIGPMLKFADIIAITKGDIVSQAEREVFAFNVHKQNKKAKILNVNGITGQGTLELLKLMLKGEERESVLGLNLRFTMPAALCSYCLGEREIGKDFQLGNVKKMELI